METNKKNYFENEYVKSFVAEYEKHHTAEQVAKLKDRTVGNNGFTLGQTFTLTGEIKTASREINGTTQVYIILPTKEGTELSLMSLMGISSLKGYEANDGIVNVEFDVNGEKKTREVKSELVNNFNFDNVWKPASRNLLELAGMIAEGDVALANKKATFLGTAVKKFTAKQGGEQNGESYSEGYTRAIETKLWKIA